MDKLQIDYSIECDICGQVVHASMDVNSTALAIKDFEDEGWRLVNGENCCPACAEDE